ncbi:ABC transporter permease subunit [Rhizobium lusitanum]|uniref:ABC transporter permease subunit n=1 Tax=Rhizobium lusitanum TaxID=293958 RepID=A0A6L9UCY7_9HYPH|nr:ABC transporter permease subunit [Rhizobium lusitanum]
MTKVGAIPRVRDVVEDDEIKPLRSGGMLHGIVRRNWSAWMATAILVIVWQLAAPHISNLLIVPPLDVWKRAVELYQDGTLTQDLVVSGQEFLFGMLLAIICGIPIGVILGISRGLETAVQPLMAGFYSVPIIAFGPVFIIAFGLGIGSKVAVVFLSAIFPIIINVTAGVQETPAAFLEMGHSLSIGRFAIIRKIILPSTLPYTMVGLRLGAARGLVGVLGGELFGATAGVGFLLVNAAQQFDTAGMYVGILCFLITGMLISSLFKKLNRWLSPWHEENNE